MRHCGRRKNLCRKWQVIVMGEADDVRKFGACACCDNEVTDEQIEYYVDAEGRVFCCVECILEYYGIEKIEV